MKDKRTKKELLQELEEVKKILKDALEVLRQIDRLPMESYHLNKFKEKHRGKL